MVEKFRKILEELEAAKGAVYLLSIMQMDDITDKWSVILSTPWEDQDSLEVFTFIVTTMKKYLTAEESALMARVALFKKQEHLIEELLRYKPGTVIENQKVDGNMIHVAYVIASNDTAVSITG